jgi:hypothetical protein
MDALRTSYEISRELGDDYLDLICLYDIKRRERRKTNSIAKQLQPRKCAACGRTPPDVPRLETAHITPLSECAETTKDNLLLLCKERPSDPELGCHTLYDQGYCSVADMRECQKRWAAGLPPTTRDYMIQLRGAFGPRPQQQGYLKAGLKHLKNKQASEPVGSEEWNSLQIQIAELTRRRAKKDALKRASAEILKVNPENLNRDSLKSRYFYEKAYIEFLSGRLDNAFEDFYVGREALKANLTNAENRWRWAAEALFYLPAYFGGIL